MRHLPWPTLLLGAICVAALGIRLHNIEMQSIWFDEAAGVLPLRDALSDGTEFSRWAVAPESPVLPRGLTGYLSVERRYDLPMVPAYFTIQYYWASVFGTGPLALRLLPILFGCLTIPLVYSLAFRCMRDASRARTAGLVAAACTALSTLQIYQSQGIRMYALNSLLCACSLYALLLATRTHRAGWWSANIAANLLLVWTHQFSAFFLLGEFVWMIAYCWQGWRVARIRKHRIRILAVWLAVQAANLIPFAAWMAAFDYAEFNRQAGWRQHIQYNWEYFASVFRVLSGYTTMSPSGAGTTPMLGVSPGTWFSVVFAAALIAVLAAVFRSRTPLRRWSCFAVASGVFLPVLVLYAATVLVSPCFLVRYVIYASLGYYILAGVAAALPTNGLARLALGALFIGSYAHQACHSEPTTWRHDWISVARYIAERATPNDQIAVFPHYERRQLFVNSDAFRADQVAPPTPYERKWIYGNAGGSHTGRADNPDPTDGRQLFDPAVPFAQAQRRFRWVILTTDASVDVEVTKLERRLNAEGIHFEKQVFGRGWAALTVYHLPGAA